MTVPKLIGCAGMALVATCAFATPSISPDSNKILHSAYSQANAGQRDRAIGTLSCLLIQNGITIGAGSGASARAVNQGVRSWSERLSDCPFTFTNSQHADIKVLFVSDIAEGGDVQGEVHCRRQVFWGRNGSSYKIHGTILIRDNVDGRPMTSQECSTVIGHELGHVLGLDDDDDTSHLMGRFVAGGPVDGPTDREVAIVREFRTTVKHTLASLLTNGNRLSDRSGHRRRHA